MSLFNEICPKELATLSTIVALNLSEENSTEDNNVLGNFLVTVGSIILTIAAQQEKLKTLQNSEKQIDNLNINKL